MSEVISWIINDYEAAKSLLSQYSNIKYCDDIDDLIRDRRSFMHNPTTYIIKDVTTVSAPLLKLIEHGNDIVIFWYESKKCPKIFKCPILVGKKSSKTAYDPIERYFNGDRININDIEDCSEFIFAINNRYINKIKGGYYFNRRRAMKVNKLIYEITHHNLSPQIAVKLLLIDEVKM